MENNNHLHQNFEGIRSCSLSKLKKILKPLGLEHTRSKSLKDISKKILTEFGGKVPDNKKDLMSLPGVGPYTTNAVLCFAFGHDISMLDTNIVRVLKRVFALESKNSRDRADKSMWEFAEKIPPKGKGKEFNYAILDFASEVCKPKNPHCKNCIMNSFCDYAQDRI